MSYVHVYRAVCIDSLLATPASLVSQESPTTVILVQICVTLCFTVSAAIVLLRKSQNFGPGTDLCSARSSVAPSKNKIFCNVCFLTNFLQFLLHLCLQRQSCRT